MAHLSFQTVLRTLWVPRAWPLTVRACLCARLLCLSVSQRMMGKSLEPSKILQGAAFNLTEITGESDIVPLVWSGHGSLSCSGSLPGLPKHLWSYQIRYQKTSGQPWGRGSLQFGCGKRGWVHKQGCLGLAGMVEVSRNPELNGIELSAEYLRKYFKAAFAVHPRVIFSRQFFEWDNWHRNRLNLQFPFLYPWLGHHVFIIDVNSIQLKNLDCRECLVGVRFAWKNRPRWRFNIAFLWDLRTCRAYYPNSKEAQYFPFNGLHVQLFLSNRKPSIYAFNGPSAIQGLMHTAFLMTNHSTFVERAQERARRMAAPYQGANSGSLDPVPSTNRNPLPTHLSASAPVQFERGFGNRIGGGLLGQDRNRWMDNCGQGSTAYQGASRILRVNGQVVEASAASLLSDLRWPC